MSIRRPCLATLFARLGLPADEVSVRRFIRHHRPLPPEVSLLQAPFWSPAQAAVLWKLHRQSSHWGEVLLQLEGALRQSGQSRQESAS